MVNSGPTCTWPNYGLAGCYQPCGVFQLWLPLRKKGQTWACVRRFLHETLQLLICEASRICTQDLHAFLQGCPLLSPCRSSLLWIRKYVPNYTPSYTIRKQLIMMVMDATFKILEMVYSWNGSLHVDCISQPNAESIVHAHES